MIRTIHQLQKRIVGRRGVKAVLENTIWLISDKLLRMLFLVFVGAWVARYLGPSQFGELAYAIALVTIFQSLAKLGLDGIVVRDIARTRDKAPEILGTTMRLRIIAGIIGAAISIAAIKVLRPGDYQALLLIVIVSGSLIFQAGDTIDLWYQSQTQSRRTVIPKATAYITANIFRVAAIYLEASLEWFAIISVIDFALAALFLAISYRRNREINKWTWARSRARSMIRESWPLMIGAFSIMIYMRIEQIMLRSLSGEKELGVYVASLTLSEAWAFIPMVIVTSLAPSITKLRTTDKHRYEAMLQTIFRIMAWLAILISIVVALSSSWLVSSLYGSAYERSALVLSIHVFTLVPIFLGVTQNLWILNEGETKVALYKSVSGAIACVACNYALIPQYGAVGAAISSVISYSISGILANALFSPRVFKMQVLAFIPSIKIKS